MRHFNWSRVRAHLLWDEVVQIRFTTREAVMSKGSFHEILLERFRTYLEKAVDGLQSN